MHMDAASLSHPLRIRPRYSKRVLSLARDETLVAHIGRGNEAAFEVVFERHVTGILGFCRHMLGSAEEAEDAVQQTFAAAYRDLQRDDERALALKPWLYTIARNRCVSMLRARREHVTGPPETATAGLAEQVERRAELRDVLRDLRALPEDQRAALLLSELGDLSHAQVSQVLGCEVTRVKALVYRARSGLLSRREARELPCDEIRAQLANLRGGSLRRNELRFHLIECAGCRAYRERVRQQRRMLAAALPVAPSVGLKSSVLAAAGVGSASTGGGIAAGLGLAGLGSGAATAAKVAAVGLLAGGGLAAGRAVVDHQVDPAKPAAPATATAQSLRPLRAGAGERPDPHVNDVASQRGIGGHAAWGPGRRGGPRAPGTSGGPKSAAKRTASGLSQRPGRARGRASNAPRPSPSPQGRALGRRQKTAAAKPAPRGHGPVGPRSSPGAKSGGAPNGVSPVKPAKAAQPAPAADGVPSSSPQSAAPKPADAGAKGKGPDKGPSEQAGAR
jgi:RNA polymerase sigma factor (sigma-70 family)